MSPSAPRAGQADRAFAKVAIPWMCMTGTHDTSPIGNGDAKSRLEVFAALPEGNKYELVLFEAEHSVFTERPLPGESKRRNPKHHRSIMALSTAFWEAYLRDDKAARQWLDGAGPKSLLDANDRWQMK